MSGHNGRPALPSDQIDFSTPHSARIWNYWQGSKHYYDVDRAAGDAFAEVFPDILPIAQQARQFLVRVVRFLAPEAGVRQFLDIGTGLPATINTHEVAQSVAPASRIVYGDNDPLVLVNARVWLRNTTDEGSRPTLETAAELRSDGGKPATATGDHGDTPAGTSPVGKRS